MELVVETAIAALIITFIIAAVLKWAGEFCITISHVLAARYPSAVTEPRQGFPGEGVVSGDHEVGDRARLTQLRDWEKYRSVFKALYFGIRTYVVLSIILPSLIYWYSPKAAAAVSVGVGLALLVEKYLRTARYLKVFSDGVNKLRDINDDPSLSEIERQRKFLVLRRAVNKALESQLVDIEVVMGRDGKDALDPKAVS